MSILKRLSLIATALSFTGCAVSSNQPVDNYYDNDFSMETSQTKEVEPAEKNEIDATNFTSNTKIVSEVSKKVAAIEAKLRQIQKGIKKDADAFRELKTKSAEESIRYYEYIARIRARLQNGTTPGNPELLEMWKQASALLSGSDKNMSDTAKLSSETARAKNEMDSLLEIIRETFSVPGAMEIDHENLKTLEDEANQTLVSLNRLASDLQIQIARQQKYFSLESQNINSLSTDIQNGVMSNNNAAATAVPAQTMHQTAAPTYLSAAINLPTADLSGRRPLMVIRFDRPDIEYEQLLYKAVKAALDKKPHIKFEVVAVSPKNTPSAETEAARNADAVREVLLSMGLPADRIYSSKATLSSAKTTEVHLYLK